MASHEENVTQLLALWRDGETQAADRLLPLVYDELRRLARRFLRQERADHTLQPTALVHEAFLRLSDQDQPTFEDRLHFFGLASRVMRQILVDHARAHAAQKRGGDVVKISLDAAQAEREPRADRLLLINDALERLETLDPRQARLVELRFFGGLTIEETAQLLSVSVPTVVNETRKAKAWLYREIHGAKSDEG